MPPPGERNEGPEEREQRHGENRFLMTQFEVLDPALCLDPWAVGAGKFPLGLYPQLTQFGPRESEGRRVPVPAVRLWPPSPWGSTAPRPPGKAVSTPGNKMLLGHGKKEARGEEAQGQHVARQVPSAPAHTARFRRSDFCKRQTRSPVPESGSVGRGDRTPHFMGCRGGPCPRGSRAEG